MKTRAVALAKLIAVATVFASLLAVAGCWNSRELDKLAIVTAMAIDRVPETGEYELAFQVVMPSSVTHQGAGNGDMPFTVYGIRAPTLFEGIRKASKQVPRQLFFSHVQVVVIGERLAKSGIMELFDFFERSHEVRLTSMMLVARGERPDKLVSILVPLEKLQSSALLGESTLSAKIWGETMAVEIDDVIRKLINAGAEPTIGGLKLVGSDKAAGQRKSMDQTRPPFHLEVSDIAMFREGKLAGWLENGSARGLMFGLNRIKSSILNLPCDDIPDGVALEIIKSKTNKEVVMQNGRLKVNVIVSAEGNVGEVKCDIALENLGVLRELEEHWEGEVRNEIMMSVRQAQAIEADVFGFGMQLQRKHPKLWKSVEKEWGKIFAEADVNVTFHGIIRRTGMRGKSIMEKP
ncbi:Ger(x)C family spore germination protein [Cohnella sp. GCM10027633]|uniref:Ger(x)C family spore germination protein n=1 Tax=unclassified Cohnella TaxID=2636738 RepID=UPI003628461A